MNEIEKLIGNITNLKQELDTLKSKLAELQSWKVKTDITVEEFPDYYLLTEFKYVSPDSDPEETLHLVEKQHINSLWRLMKENLSFGIIYRYRDIVELIMREHGLHFDINAFNGGQNRTKYYFPLYYYPCRVLAELGRIRYFGHGHIQRIQ